LAADTMTAMPMPQLKTRYISASAMLPAFCSHWNSAGIVHGMAHITGGGITENVPRVIPDGLTARIDSKSWALPALFQWLQKAGNIADAEMYRVFNCGIGMAVIVSAANAEKAAAFLGEQGETVHVIGRIAAMEGDQPKTIVE
jgi:phosphoribosylformylglycinamidine cyclo-ligase